MQWGEKVMVGEHVTADETLAAAGEEDVIVAEDIVPHGTVVSGDVVVGDKDLAIRVLNGQELDAFDIMRNYPVIFRTDMIQRNKYILGDNAGNSLSAMEYKIIFSMVSRITKNDTELKPQAFRIPEFCKLCGINMEGGRTWKNMRDVLKKLAQRAMWLYEKDPVTGKEHVSIIRWLQDVDFSPSDGSITLYFDQKMKPFLLGLSENYTKLYLHDTLRMRSKYSMMLYQLLASYAFLRRPIVFDVEDFLQRMDCSKPSYSSNFTMVRRRVIEPAIMEINKYTVLDVRVEYIRDGRGRGRSVKKVRFIIHNLKAGDSMEDSAKYVERFNAVEQELVDAGAPAYDIGEDTVVDKSYLRDFDASEHDAVSNPIDPTPPLFRDEM